MEGSLEGWDEEIIPDDEYPGGVWLLQVTSGASLEALSEMVVNGQSRGLVVYDAENAWLPPPDFQAETNRKKPTKAQTRNAVIDEVRKFAPDVEWKRVKKDDGRPELSFKMAGPTPLDVGFWLNDNWDSGTSTLTFSLCIFLWSDELSDLVYRLQGLAGLDWQSRNGTVIETDLGHLFTGRMHWTEATARTAGQVVRATFKDQWDHWRKIAEDAASKGWPALLEVADKKVGPSHQEALMLALAGRADEGEALLRERPFPAEDTEQLIAAFRQLTDSLEASSCRRYIDD